MARRPICHPLAHSSLTPPTGDTCIILTAREVDESVQTISVVKEPDRAKYHDLAGADAVLSPRGLLGESLASKVTTGVSTTLGDSIEIGEDFDIAELPIHRGSDLVGTTLADSGIRERPASTSSARGSAASS